MDLVKIINSLERVGSEHEREGINLTCHDYLIAYYEKHGFVNEGRSQSTFAGETWYDMVWEAKISEKSMLGCFSFVLRYNIMDCQRGG